MANITVGTGDFVVRAVFAEFREEADKAIKNVERGFNKALTEVERFESALSRVARTARGIELAPEFEEFVKGLRAGLEEARAQLGEPLFQDIELPARDVADQASQISSALREIERDIENIQRASAAELIEPGEASRAIAELNQEFDRLGGNIRQGELDRPFQSLSQAAIQASRQLSQLQREVSALRQATREGLIPRGVAGEEIQRTNAAIRQLGGETRRMSLEVRNNTQEQLANARSVQQLTQQRNLLNRTLADSVQKTRAITQIDRQLASIGGQISKTTTTFAQRAQQAGGLFGFIGKASEAATSTLSKFGLTMRDLNVIVGAGFLSTAGPALAILLGVQIVQAVARAIAALVRFGIEAAKAADATQFALRSVQSVFGQFSGDIEDFAERSSAAFGTTRREALAFSAEVGRFFESIGVGAEASAELTEGLLFTAEILRRTSGSFISSAEALQAVRDLVGGNIEGLRKLNVRLTESGLQAVAAAHGIDNFGDSLDDTERGLLSTLAALDAARKRLNDARSAPESLAESFERFRATMALLIEEIGEELLPVVQFVLKGFIGLAIVFLSTVRAIKAFINNVRELQERMGFIGKVVGEFLKTILPLARALDTVVKGLRALGQIAEATEDDLFTDAARELDEAMRDTTETARDLVKVFTNDELERFADQLERAADAVRDAEEAVVKAEINLARAREDAAFRAEDAQRRLADAYRERNEKIGDANRKLADVERENLERLEDAQEKLGDARVKAFRAIRDAEERLSDARIDAARRVDDAERKLADERRKRTEEILNANLSLFDALRKGDAEAENRARLELSQAQQTRSVADAQRNLRETRADEIRKLDRLERDLAETRIDALDDIADAERELAQVIEDNIRREEDARRNLQRVIEETNRKIAEAQRDLARTEIENNRRLFDARQSLNEATERVIETQEDLKKAIEEVNEALGTTGLNLRQLLDNLLLRQANFNDLVLANLNTQQQITDELEQQVKHYRSLSELGVDLAGGLGAGVGVGGLQHGGLAPAGTPFVVGERGPELFIPNQTGTVVSNDQLIRVLRQLVESPVRPFGNPFSSSPLGGANINIFEAYDADATAAAFFARLGQFLNT